MDLFVIASILIVLSAIFGYINIRFLKLPNTIGLMVIAILFTIGLFLTSLINNSLLQFAEQLISEIDFKTVLLDVMLGFLLFAGASVATLFGQEVIGGILFGAVLGWLTFRLMKSIDDYEIEVGVGRYAT